MPVRSISYWITTEPTKRRASSGGSLAIRDISCTSPRPAAHGSIKWSGGLQASRRSAFVADRSRACPVLKKRFRIISTTITSTRNLSSGPQTPNSSSARFNDFVNEFLTQDTSGNFTSGGSNVYDGRNRLVSTTWPSGIYYFYDSQNHRVFQNYGGNPSDPGQITLYGAYGERLATYGFVGPFDTGGPMGIVYSVSFLKENVWFNGRNIAGNTISWSGTPIVGDSTFYQDRVGTDRSGGARYRPYGDEITSTSNDREKFGTYIRDSATGFDYADQRYYASAYGRFNTPDPYKPSASPKNPGSWNRYTYVLSDPVNHTDRHGREVDCTDDDGDDDGCDYGPSTDPCYDASNAEGC